MGPLRRGPISPPKPRRQQSQDMGPGERTAARRNVAAHCQATERNHTAGPHAKFRLGHQRNTPGAPIRSGKNQDSVGRGGDLHGHRHCRPEVL